MGVDTYPCVECEKCFYDYWAMCESCRCGCEEWLDKSICLDCIKNEKYDLHRLAIYNEEFVLCYDCVDCISDPITKLYDNINKAYQNHKYCEKSLNINVEDLEEAIKEHNNFFYCKERVRGRYLKEIVNLMEKIQKDIQEVEKIGEKIKTIV